MQKYQIGVNFMYLIDSLGIEFILIKEIKFEMQRLLHRITNSIFVNHLFYKL